MSDEQVGVSVYCAVCGKRKAPVGRSVAAAQANSLCNSDCEGYWQDPQPGELWPGETREQFGY